MKSSINYYFNKDGFITDIDYRGGLIIGAPENATNVNFRESRLAEITEDYTKKLKEIIPELKRINIQVTQGNLK